MSEPLTEAQLRIFRGFGFTDAEAAAIVASPEHQAYVRARAEAEAEQAAFVENAEALAAKVSADLTAKLLAGAGAFGLNAGEQPLPHVFIQWKGTDACFDFWCSCGAALHYDGYFAYNVQCGACELVWEMPHILYPRPATADAAPLRRLEPE